MSASLEDLYKQVIIDHYRNPKNKGDLPSPPAMKAKGYNPNCGDDVTMYLEVDDDRLSRIRLVARGCAVSVASASMMSEAVEGKAIGDLRVVADRFRTMLRARDVDLTEAAANDTSTLGANLGDLEALKGVARVPERIKCAMLPWVTLEQGLADTQSGAHEATPISTEEGGSADGPA